MNRRRIMAVYAVYRGESDWTLLYLGYDSSKFYAVGEFAQIHFSKSRKVTALGNAVIIK